MVDVDRPIPGLNPAHLAGLRRLSARAAAPAATLPHQKGLLSFASLSQNVLSRLQSAGIPIDPGLSEAEFALLEAELRLSFPPDLRAFLSAGLPNAPGFPNWRSRRHRLPSLRLPTAAVSLQIARNSLWPKSWGPRAADPKRALLIGRYALQKAPPLIPLFGRCYIPSSPSLAGNPVFFVDEHRIICCGLDLADFFEKNPIFLPSFAPCLLSATDKHATSSYRSSSDSVGKGRMKNPRWIEFWSDAASTDRSRCRSPYRASVINRPIYRLKRPKWVEGYLEKIGCVLREGGWEDSDVEDIVHVSEAGFLEEEVVLLESEAVLDLLVLKAERFSDALRRAGWGSEDVREVLGFELRPKTGRIPAKKLPPKVVERIGRLVELSLW